ncbi:MAG TPA: glycosyltransferase family 4 protein [Terracidiphilus sp.]|nr:glycosyltransferase family 4 protein [Terracidiphilus sp.]
MRVLIIDPAGGLWGSERALLDLIGALEGIDIAVCCPPDTPLQETLEKSGTPVFPLFIADLHQRSRMQRLRAALGVFRACRAFRPNVVYVNQAGAYRVVLQAACLLDLPIVCHVRIFEDADYLARRKPTARRLRGLIAISGAIEEEIRRDNRLDGIPVYKIYDGYALGCCEPIQAKNAQTPPRIAFVGRIVPIKGVDILMKALAIEKVFSESTECLICGDGSKQYLEHLQGINRANEHVRISWLGYVKNAAVLLRTCKVLACPSNREPLGRVILEAWEAGCVPVVFSGAGGSAEIIAAAGGGIIYEEQTPECLAHALVEAMALDHAERERLIENGRAWMKQHCAPEPYGRAVAAVLEEACA